jgi:GNAT superfamily N-acetyltransferase
MSAGIREAQYFDLDDIIKIVRAMCLSNEYFSKHPFDDEMIISLVVDCIEKKTHFCWVGVDKEGEIISAFLGKLEYFIFSKDFFAHDFGAYTYPEHRKSRVAYQLLKMFMDWAKAMGASEIHLSATNGFSEGGKRPYASRFGKFLQRNFGFTEGGSWYTQDPKNL